jgi:hypothetical protein
MKCQSSWIFFFQYFLACAHFNNDILKIIGSCFNFILKDLKIQDDGTSKIEMLIAMITLYGFTFCLLVILYVALNWMVT